LEEIPQVGCAALLAAGLRRWPEVPFEDIVSDLLERHFWTVMSKIATSPGIVSGAIRADHW
jgi:hypothetical protein